MKKRKTAYFLVQSAMIAAIYIVLTLMFIPLGFGPVQFRISEALCILPYFTPAAIPGVFIGCLLSNALGGAVFLDVVFGSLATLIGAVGSWLLRRVRWAVCIPPILSNVLIIPWVLRFAYGNGQIIPYLMVTVGMGEVLAVGVLGNLLMLSLERYKKILFK
ncbi:QueT transporter family protein [Clostridium sp. MCC353]|uniref:QueT transporter family protein n=1 Tax=Clostridium sp. MCC353 TaxID=2592646 RepID=UPI001C02C246|nr:QueT transporter family protein [Clostridium sp. MCC353]MBT9779104.1 QueT transporter family protein [Clostridium sp. MCC353]